MSEPFAGLYVHVPFCTRVCPYCDFAVRTGDAARRLRYVDHLLVEIELYADTPLVFDTIYFGGGTPSLLDPADLARIVETLRERMRLLPGYRIFLEANPEEITPERIAAWREFGVSTLSIGVQSLEESSLEFLGRRHGVEGARRAVEFALAGGFETVSIDLIYGLPGQRPEDWRAELERAAALGAAHISCYQLTIHQGTRFGLLARRGQLAELPEDGQGELFRLTHRRLEARGYAGYEVSQFAIDPSHRSRHNRKYWDHTPYLGLGPAAHSFHERKRWWNLRRVDPWQEALDAARRPVEESEELDDRAMALEALMTGLRTHAGVDLARLRSHFGVDLLALNRRLVERLRADRLLDVVGERLVPSLDGLAVADTLATAFRLRGGAPAQNV